MPYPVRELLDRLRHEAARAQAALAPLPAGPAIPSSLERSGPTASGTRTATAPDPAPEDSFTLKEIQDLTEAVERREWWASVSAGLRHC